MNAYIASFMLLLFNAVGLAVPASAAAEEHMVPRMGSAAALADIAADGQSAVVESAPAALVDHPFAAMVAVPVSRGPAPEITADRTLQWAVVPMVAEAGDKLEHEEGAP